MYDIIPTTIRIQEETKRNIEQIAEVEKRSFNKMVEYILQSYIFEYMQKMNGEDKEKD